MSEKMNIKEIIREVNMSTRPGYYSGRGATLTDLNSKILNKIADLIQENYGQIAFDSFVEMIWNMKELSATSFLVNLYKLEANEWKSFQLSNEKIYFENIGEAFCTIAETFIENKNDDTNIIRSAFKGWSKRQIKYNFLTGNILEL